MKKDGLKAIVGLFIAVFVMLFAGSTVVYATEEEDTRTHIDRVDISTNINDVFGYEKENTTLQPTFQMSQTTSEPVKLTPYYGFWQRYIDDDGRWEFSGYEYFISGQWSMTIQIRVTDVAYLIDNETAVYVDGELWEVWTEEDGSYPFIVVIPSRNSSRFFIEEPEELTFHKFGKYDISGQRVNTLIEPFSVVSSVEGGTEPYSYRKVSGPDWLEVSNEGTVSGKPTETGANEPLVVEVLDSQGGTAQITIPVADTSEENVIEVSSWQELENAFSQARGSSVSSKKEYLTIRLTKDLYSSAYSTERDAQWIHQYEIYCASVIFDFNGHTLSCEDNVSDTDFEYTLKDFINIKLTTGSYSFGSSIRFIDSAGGGGIKMYSKRAYETCDLAALHIEAGESSFYGVHQVYFDGGKYELNAESSKVSVGTLSPLVDYRGCVITEEVSVEINDGHFIAKGEGAKFSVGDTCARELSAFGTFEHARFNVTSVEEIEKMFGWDEIVINGGVFESNGYAVHHFDISEKGLDSTRGMLFPTINGGYFIGQMGYTGLTFTYSDGNELFNNQPATSIISKDSYVMGIDKDGDKFYTLEGMTLKDLHDLQSCVVLGKETVQMKTTPVAGSYPAALIRESTQTETYTMEYKEPFWFAMGGIRCVPYYSIQGWNSGVTPTSKTGKTEVMVDYSKYKHNGGVDVILGVMYLTPWNTTDYSFENEYNVELQVFYDVTDACENCYITPVNGKSSVFKGDDFTFKITADKDYKININGPLEVSINPSKNAGEITWDSATNTYTVADVVGDISISVDKGVNGPIGQLQLKLESRAGVLTNLGTIAEKEEYTLKTPAEYGLNIPNNYTFEKWIIMTSTSTFSAKPGDTLTLDGSGYVIISPKYENLYNIQVINGTAYADAEHTQPISNAVDEQRVYIVADEPGEGKVFWSWDVIDGYNGIPVGEYGNPETTYYVNMDDALLEACYATPIDEVTFTILNEDIIPEAGMQVPVIEKVNRDAYTFYPPNYYDVTDGGHRVVFPDIENFQVGHIYQLETSVSKVDGYLLADIKDMTLHIEGLSESEYESVELQPVKYYENEEYKIIIRFPAIEGEEGVTVSGTITSSGSESDLVKVTLTKVDNKNISYMRLLVGNSTTYSMEGVLPGTYTLRVTKAGHKTGEYTVNVGNEAVKQDVTLSHGTYTVTFSANGGTGTMKAVSGVFGEYTLPDCGFAAPGGQRFKAWSVDGTERAVGDKVSVYADITITAVWEKVTATIQKPYKIANVVNGVHVYWNAVKGVTQYGVWRSETGKDGTYKWLGNPSATDFTDTKVTSGVTYFYRITTYDASAKKHGEKSEATGIIYVGTPDITERENVTGGIRLGWDKIEGATGYGIYRKNYEGEDDWKRVATIEGNETFRHTDTTVGTADGAMYRYTIRALAGADRKTLSGCRNTGRTMIRLTDREITKVTAGSNSFVCYWTTTDKADGYELLLTDAAGRKTTSKISDNKTGTKTFEGLTPGAAYKIQVRSYKTAAEVGTFHSAWSEAKSVTPEGNASIPVPVKPYKITNVVSGVHVYWNAVSGVEKYGLWRSENGKNGTYKWIANPTVAHFTDTKVESGKTYYYKVTAMDSEKKVHGEKSEAVGVIYVATPDITSRSNVTEGIALGWGKVEGATGYGIYRKSYAGSDAWVRIATIEGNKTFSYTDKTVSGANGTVYRYTIRALAGADRKTLSGCRNTGRTMVRLADTTLSSTNVSTATTAKCTWTTTSQATGYEVCFKAADGKEKIFKVTDYKIGTKTFTGLTSKTTYTVRVRSYKTIKGVGTFYSNWSVEKKVTMK